MSKVTPQMARGWLHAAIRAWAEKGGLRMSHVKTPVSEYVDVRDSADVVASFDLIAATEPGAPAPVLAKALIARLETLVRDQSTDELLEALSHARVALQCLEEA